jgi:Protein of unknown function (DUF3147)
MSSPTREPSIVDRLPERPALKPGQIKEVRPRELAYRFVAGALTSVVAGVIGVAFGPKAGGILLAFPAILAASLTLIAEQEDSVEAREDGRGAVLGGCALAAFAAAGALTLGSVTGAIALLVATAAWFGVALLGYLLLWWR